MEPKQAKGAKDTIVLFEIWVENCFNYFPFTGLGLTSEELSSEDANQARMAQVMDDIRRSCNLGNTQESVCLDATARGDALMDQVGERGFDLILHNCHLTDMDSLRQKAILSCGSRL